jgi:tetratricopeptide (TPR) repeat protein
MPAVQAAMRALDDARDPLALQAARNDLNARATSIFAGPSDAIETLPRITLEERSGRKTEKEHIANLLSASKDRKQAAWLAFHVGAEWHAAGAALAAVESESPDPSLLLLWKAICAALASNLAAIDELKALLGSPDEPLILDPLLRGLAATDQIDEADRIVAEVCERHALAPWQRLRLLADVRLDSESTATVRDAASRLTRLTADESLPLIDRAEIWHNLGTAHDRLGDRDAAIQAFERASALNPFLDAAREELERLRAPKPTS